MGRLPHLAGCGGVGRLTALVVVQALVRVRNAQLVADSPEGCFRIGNECFVSDAYEAVGRNVRFESECLFLVFLPVFGNVVDMFLAYQRLAE